METSSKTARQLYEEVKKNPTRKRFGFGAKPALINIDLQMFRKVLKLRLKIFNSIILTCKNLSDEV